MSITAKLVKELREQTGQPMMECKKALLATEGDLGAAEEYLRKQGAKVAEKKAHRETAEGTIGTYLHHDGKTAVMVEVNCETDFVAKNEDFRAFVKDLSLQICAYAPLGVSRESLDPALVEKEKEIILAQIDQDEKNKNKPDQVKTKIAEGRLNKFFGERVLMEQPFIHNGDITVEQRRQEIVQKVRENVTVRRFVRYHVGED